MELGSQGRPPGSSRAAVWQRVGTLLAAGDYGAAGKQLRNALSDAEEHGAAELTGVLSAAVTLCQACESLDSALAHHRQAAQEVVREQTELQGQLLSLIQLLLAHDAGQEPSSELRAGPQMQPGGKVTSAREPARGGRLGDIIARLRDLLSSSPRSPPTKPDDLEDETGLSGSKPAEAPPKLPSAAETRLLRDVVARTSLQEHDESGLPIPRWRRLFTLRSETAAGATPEPAEPTESPDDSSPDLKSGSPQTEEQPPVASGPIGAEVHDRRVDVEEFAEPQGPTVAIYCLGPFRVYLQDTLVEEWLSLKGLTILKYLAARDRKPVAKDVLIDLLWPEADPEAGRRNLHQAIYALRQTLRQYDPSYPYIKFRNDCYLLNPGIRLWIDAMEFGRRADAGRRLLREDRLGAAMAEFGAAEGLYQGPFLEEDRYEEWTRRPRRQLRNRYLQIADRLSDYYHEQGQFGAAVTLCQKALRQDDCHEAAHQHLMACYLALGQRHLALRQYRLCVQKLQSELDLPPSSETQALYQRITGRPG